MQLNVVVICACYFLRFVYDLMLLIANDWFTKMRRDQAEMDAGHNYYYSLFFFTVLMVVEYFPITMFTLNLKFVFHHQAEMKPRVGVSQPPSPMDA